MTYSCPAWEFAAETHLMKLLRLQAGFSAPLAKTSILWKLGNWLLKGGN
jgi:hypothetical protein